MSNLSKIQPEYAFQILHTDTVVVVLIPGGASRNNPNVPEGVCDYFTNTTSRLASLPMVTRFNWTKKGFEVEVASGYDVKKVYEAVKTDMLSFFGPTKQQSEVVVRISTIPKADLLVFIENARLIEQESQDKWCELYMDVISNYVYYKRGLWVGDDFLVCLEEGANNSYYVKKLEKQLPEYGVNVATNQ